MRIQAPSIAASTNHTSFIHPSPRHRARGRGHGVVGHTCSPRGESVRPKQVGRTRIVVLLIFIGRPQDAAKKNSVRALSVGILHSVWAFGVPFGHLVNTFETVTDQWCAHTIPRHHPQLEVLRMSPLWGSNPRPYAYEAHALPTELRRHCLKLRSKPGKREGQVGREGGILARPIPTARRRARSRAPIEQTARWNAHAFFEYVQGV